MSFSLTWCNDVFPTHFSRTSLTFWLVGTLTSSRTQCWSTTLRQLLSRYTSSGWRTWCSLSTYSNSFWRTWKLIAMWVGLGRKRERVGGMECVCIYTHVHVHVYYTHVHVHVVICVWESEFTTIKLQNACTCTSTHMCIHVHVHIPTSHTWLNFLHS